MNARRTVGFILFIFYLFLSMNSYSATNANTYIHIRGSSVMYLLMQPLAEAYMKEHPGTFVVMTTTSSGSSARGLKSLLEGTSNIAMSTEDPDDLSMKMMMEKGITLERSVVGYDVVTPFVNNQNPISALTEDQLKQIYTGEIRNWKEVGGADQPILAAGQLPGSPASFIWNKIVLDGETFPSVDTKKMDARHVLKYVEDHPYAIGYGALHLTKKSSKVKNVSVDHVLVNPDTIMTSPYRLKRELVFYTLPDSSPDVKNFVAYVVAHGQEQINQMMFNNQNQ